MKTADANTPTISPLQNWLQNNIHTIISFVVVGLLLASYLLVNGYHAKQIAKVHEELKVTYTEVLHGININTATSDELLSLPGIGEARTKKVLQFRETGGVFTSKEQFKQVTGCSQKQFEELIDLIVY